MTSDDGWTFYRTCWKGLPPYRRTPEGEYQFFSYTSRGWVMGIQDEVYLIEISESELPKTVLRVARKAAVA